MNLSISEVRFFQKIQELIAAAESKLLYEVLGLYDVGGLIKIKFQSESAIFDCKTLVKQYLANVLDLLVERYKELQ